MGRRAMRGLGIGFAASILLAYLGAMGTGVAPFGVRLAYWASVIVPGSLLGLVFSTLVLEWGGLARHRWAEIVMVAVAVSLPHTFLVVVASAVFFGLEAITPLVVAEFWLAVLVIALVLTAINHLVAVPDGATPDAALPMRAVDPEPPGPTMLVEETASLPTLPDLPKLIAEKLPGHLRQARLIAIEAEDHYLCIHTDAGSDLVLMRMADACALLPEAAGARVHRSWWAARGAVETLTRREGKAALTLHRGLVVPVSRAMRASLRNQGWGESGSRISLQEAKAATSN